MQSTPKNAIILITMEYQKGGETFLNTAFLSHDFGPKGFREVQK